MAVVKWNVVKGKFREGVELSKEPEKEMGFKLSTLPRMRLT